MPPVARTKRNQLHLSPYSSDPPLESERARKDRERLRLACAIESLGDSMDPCSLCIRQKRKCVVDARRSSKCSECIRSGVSCDVRIPLAAAWDREVPRESDWESIAKQKTHLEEQEEEAMAKILRLRKQKRFLEQRELEMSRRGLRYLEELDAAEEQERLNKETAEKLSEQTAPEPSSSAFPTSDSFFPASGSTPFDPSVLDPTLWADLGFVDETPPRAQSSH